MRSHFVYHSASTMLKRPSLIPETPGAYLICASSTTLSATPLRFAHATPIVAVGHVMLHAGATADLRAGVAAHYVDDTRSSWFRFRLGVLLAGYLGLRAAEDATEEAFHFDPESERRLTTWLTEATSIGWTVQPDRATSLWAERGVEASTAEHRPRFEKETFPHHRLRSRRVH